MIAYYFNLALRSFRRNKALTALMVLSIALGIGASMTTMTVFYVLSGDPLPGRSHTLFYPQLDAEPLRGFAPGDEPADQLTRYDAETLLREKRGDRQTLTTGGSASIALQGTTLAPFRVESRYSSSDFFPMFDVPFLYGSGWPASSDENRERVTVIAKALNERVFGGENSVGRSLQIEGASFEVIGVIDDWRPTPKFYDMYSSRFGKPEQVFVPFSTSRDLRLARSGNMNCWGDSGEDPEGSEALNAPCVWIQYWVQLDTPAKAADYRQYLAQYSARQRSAGRFERPDDVRLHDLMGWLDENNVVPGDVRLQLWLALGFLVVCLVNTVGLLLAKFLRRSSEIGVRRALGASRRDVFFQCLVEAGTVGLAGGVLGLGLAQLGLWAVRHQPASYAELARLDPVMLASTFVLAIAVSLLAGLLPAWRAMQVTPAIQLKSQ